MRALIVRNVAGGKKTEREGTKVQRLFMLLLNACRGPESKSRHVKEEG